MEGQWLDAHGLHALTLLLVEELQLEHGQNAVPIEVHAAEPVLYAAEVRTNRQMRCGWAFSRQISNECYEFYVLWMLSPIDA